MKKEYRMICNRCNHTFNLKDAAVIYKNLCGIDIQENVCPKCKGDFRNIEIPHELDKYLFVDNDERYYSYPDKGGN